MIKKIIHAISFLYKDERLMVKPNTFGKFKIPVSEAIDGDLRTSVRFLTAMQVIKHDIIKNCDPTLYLENNERMRVFPAGDSSYLPAHVEGIVRKHDSLNKISKLKPKVEKKNQTTSKFNYEQASLDIYGWYPGYDDGTAD
jgi:hypothetical protein